MKKSIKYILIVIFLLLSFYYTKYITNIIISKSKLMNEIKLDSPKYNVNYINGTINGEYIIPGIKGKKVNELKSYYIMKELGYYDPELFVYDDVIPVISITEEKGKIIKNGNTAKNAVSILIDSNELLNYCKKNKINCTSIKDDFNNKYCLYNNSNCNLKQKIEPTYTFYNESIININISSGDIILIDNNLSIEIFIYLIKTIKYYNLDIVSLELLLME